MRKLITLLILFAAPCFLSLHAEETDALIRQLDKAIALRGKAEESKTRRIDSLKRLLRPGMPAMRRLDIYDRLYDEYLTFNFDSTMFYVEKAAALAQRMNNYDRSANVSIHRALSLATAGHFSNAMQILIAIDSSRLPLKLREEYFAACEWTYGVWAEYAEGESFAERYRERSLAYLDSLITVTNHKDAKYLYRNAERALRTGHYETAEKLYLRALGATGVNSRLYAQAAYALATTYKSMGRNDMYEKWLIKAAISDQVTPLKENLALQQLALYLKEQDGDLDRANAYLKTALDDAVFYNNRLRMLEIAEKIPEITNVYQQSLLSENHKLMTALWIIGAFAILTLVLGATVYIGRRRLTTAKHELTDLNTRLSELNIRLSATNSMREKYTSLFMDLCVTYIDKLNRLPMTLRLKVKSLADLNSVAERYIRPGEAEVREMFFHFDSAFLRLYPDFIEKFNALLRPGEGVWPKRGELLCTDLRIYALVRMGITESHKIASLLFLSPQTIFNHRTQVRNRAIDRSSFETDVATLSSVLS